MELEKENFNFVNILKENAYLSTFPQCKLLFYFYIFMYLKSVSLTKIGY